MEYFKSNENFKNYARAMGEWIKLYGNLDVTKPENEIKLFEFSKTLNQ